MKQFKLTRERTNFSRADVQAMLEKAPKRSKKAQAVHMRLELKKAGLSSDEIDKIVSDLDSYQMLDPEATL